MERNTNAYYNLLAATVEAFNERIQDDKIREGDDYQDVLFEVVDSNVPVYYSEIYTVMSADGVGTHFEDESFMPETRDVTEILQARIFDALYHDVPNNSNVVWYEDEEEEE